MEYTKIIFAASGQPHRDMLTGLLDGAGYHGFEETDHELFAYIETTKFNNDILQYVLAVLPGAYRIETVPERNWNEFWESNFEPVVVDDFCTIRAHFHSPTSATPHEIIITPKMSFGTGHHATTQLMMVLMKDLDFKDRQVLDFGAGTGVLAILAEKLGARQVLAIDTDEWAVDNARENTDRNHSNRIFIQKASVEDIKTKKFDIILANINRHILLSHMLNLYELTNADGDLLISGILAEDMEMMMEAAIKAGFQRAHTQERSGWAALRFKKI